MIAPSSVIETVTFRLVLTKSHSMLVTHTTTTLAERAREKGAMVDVCM